MPHLAARLLDFDVNLNALFGELRRILPRPDPEILVMTPDGAAPPWQAPSFPCQIDWFSHGGGAPAGAPIRHAFSGSADRLAGISGRYDAIFCLNAFPAGIAPMELFARLRALVKTDGILYGDFMHRAWEDKLEATRRLLQLFEARQPVQAGALFQAIGTFSSLWREFYQPAFELLQKSPALFQQTFQAGPPVLMDASMLNAELREAGWALEAWADAAFWDQNPLKGSALESEWEALAPTDRTALLEHLYAPRMRLWLKPAQPAPRIEAPDVASKPAPCEATSDKVASLYNLNPYPTVQGIEHDESNLDLINHLSHRCYGKSLPKRMRILVAGCGTKQGPEIAKKFPDAQVEAIDITANSIALSERVAQDVKAKNVRFHLLDIQRAETLEGQFELIFCTGVLHHMKDPLAGLRAISAKLADGGLMHLMVYNTYHRHHAQNAQKLIHRFPWTGEQEKIDKSKKLFEHLKKTGTRLDSTVEVALMLHQSDIRLYTDTMLHPQERSYTVPELFDWLDRAGLRLVTFVHDYLWSLDDVIPPGGLREAIARKDRRDRLETVNLLLPAMMEFYAEKKSEPETRRVCDADNDLFSKIIPKKREFTLYQYQKKGGAFKKTRASPSFEPLPNDQVRFSYVEREVYTVGHRIVRDFFDLTDGRRDIRTIAELAGKKYNLKLEQTLPFAIQIFKKFFYRQQMTTISHCPSCRYAKR